MTALVHRLIFVLTVLAAIPARAVGPDDMIDARILTGWRQSDGRHVAALQFTLHDGWKTYWRAPGDAGIPPRFDWGASSNLRDSAITWPAPEVIMQSGVRTIGFTEQVTLPLTLSPDDPDRPIALSGKLDIGVCKEVCVPVSLHVSARLPADAADRDPRIVAALASQPLSADEAGVGQVRCRLSPRDDGLGLRAEIRMPPVGGREMVIVEADDPDVWLAQPRVERKGEWLVAETEMAHVDGRAFGVNRSGLRITVLGHGRAVDIRGCPAP
ncbi:protein-disulfide reductase DsbD domain-containing protein [Roseovarius salinarum]|uniref:protein-disulfide reductase DsbD domain-containing protein n=1 Tax=Roseovarius salinarum TaxID=1981892 RepID=UPI000C32F9C8|nr:protein-disulfide reductase DsbD domain-containing protein [Roseovarius salinarum]